MGNAAGHVTIRDNDTGEELELPKNVPNRGFTSISGATLRGSKLSMEFEDASLNSTSIGPSSICNINGKQSSLTYRGFPIETLADNATYDQVAFLLTNVKEEKLPTQAQLADYRAGMALNGAVSVSVAAQIKAMPRNAKPMGMLQRAVAALDDEISDQPFEMQARLLQAKMPTIVAMVVRHRRGLDFVQPDPNLSSTENFLNMCFNDGTPDFKIHPAKVKAMDVLRILHAEHEMNASTLAVLVAGSAGSTPATCIANGVGTLAGPLHGGANTAVLKMVDEIGSVENVSAFLDDVERGLKKMMGGGHRIYKSDDPREKITWEFTPKLLADLGIDDKRVAILLRIREEMRTREYFTKRDIFTNVDFATGIPYTAIGFDKEELTLLFAESRVAGQVAHLLEQKADPNTKIMRPRHRNMGPAKNLEWVPIEQRGGHNGGPALEEPPHP